MLILIACYVHMAKFDRPYQNTSLSSQQSHPDARLACASSVLNFCIKMVVSSQQANDTPLKMPSSSRKKIPQKKKV